jgi:hypothetical protein
MASVNNNLGFSMAQRSATLAATAALESVAHFQITEFAVLSLWIDLFHGG